MEEDKYISDQTLAKDEKSVSLSALANFCITKFEANKRFRNTNGIDDELLECKHAVAGEYNETEKAKRIAKGMPLVYAPISDMKRRAANAWASEIFLNTDEKTYVLHPTPIPDMPKSIEEAIAARIVEEFATLFEKAPETDEEFEAIRQMASQRRDEVQNLIKEEAEVRAARMEKVVQDRLAEGRWREEMTKAIDYASTYGTAVVKIVNRTRKRIVRKTNKYGISTYSLKYEPRMEFEAIDPFDCYPSKGSEDIQDGYFCQRVRFEPNELNAMLGQKNYFDDVIKEAVFIYGDKGLRTWQNFDSQKEELGNDGPIEAEQSTTIEGFEFWGNVNGNVLMQSMVTKDANGKNIDPDKFYEIDAIIINSRVMYCEMTDERLGRPLFKGTFYKVPGSWWGESPIKKMRSAQKIANGAYGALAFNMQMSSGPQACITDIDRLQNKDLSMEPWKLWVFRSKTSGATTDVPIKFFQPPSNASELISVYQYQIKESDTMTGIPAYSYGSDTAAGAGRTASGLSMLMDAAQRGMKHIVFSLDIDLMRPIVKYIVDSEMITSDDEGIKGDVMIDAGGLLAILTRDKSMAMLREVLALCQNPLVANVIGEDGIATIVRRLVVLIPNINPDEIVPSKEKREFEKMKAQMQQMKMQQMQKAQQAQAQAQQAQQGGAQGAPVEMPPEMQQGGGMPQQGADVNQYQQNMQPSGEMQGAEGQSMQMGGMI